MPKKGSLLPIILVILLFFPSLCFAQSDSVIATIWLPDELGGVANPCAFTYNSINNKIYVCGGERVVVIDGVTNQRMAGITVGKGATALAYNPKNNKIYCANYGSESVTIIDGEGDSVIGTVGVGAGSWALVYNPTNNKIYCANNSWDITIIDGAGDSVIATVEAGGCQGALIYNPISNKIYCADICSDHVIVIDGAGDSVIATVEVGPDPWALAYDPANNKVYCGDHDDNVTVMDGEGDSVMATVGVEHYPSALAYNPTNNKIYCAVALSHFPTSDSDNVTIIDGTTDSVIASVTLGVWVWPSALVHNTTNNKVYCANEFGPSGPHISVIACSPPTTVEEDQETQVITDFSLKQNYPNPFNPTTSIRYAVGSRQTPIRTTLEIYNILGQKLRTLVDEPKGRGNHEVIWDGKDDKGKEVASGIYLYRLKVGEFIETKKMLLLK